MLPTGKENYSSPSHILMIQEEKPLKFYQHYTLQNCVMECQANYTLIHCGCNMYFQVGQDRTNLGNDDFMTLCFSQEERAIHFAVPSSYFATKKLLKLWRKLHFLWQRIKLRTVSVCLLALILSFLPWHLSARLQQLTCYSCLGRSRRKYLSCPIVPLWRIMLLCCMFTSGSTFNNLFCCFATCTIRGLSQITIELLCYFFVIYF